MSIRSLDASALETELDCDISLSEHTFSDMSSEISDEIALFDEDFTLEEDEANPEKVDLQLAQEMTGLSMNEREKVYFDIHGVASDITETPEMVAENLQKLHEALGQLEEAVAYRKALSMDPSYVQNPKFQLSFLRSTRFDPRTAAKRLVAFFEAKLNLFGSELLVKDLTEDDLDEEDIEVMYQGLTYTMPLRDRAGRVVTIHFPQPPNLSVRLLLRKSFYLLMKAINDEETQKKGIVLVSYMVGHPLTWEEFVQRRRLNREWDKLHFSLPIRIEAVHLCADSLTWRPIFAVFKITASLFTRVRVREHIGDHKEVLFSLQTFGISTHGFPASEDGEIMWQVCREQVDKKRMFERNLKEEAARESQNETPTPKRDFKPVHVSTPGNNDVLLGRGRACYTHIGNIRLRDIVLAQSKEYEKAKFKEKQIVCGEIVAKVKSQSGRFLREEVGGWLEVDDVTARLKVSHAFRTLRKFKNIDDGGMGLDEAASQKSGKRKNADV